MLFKALILVFIVKSVIGLYVGDTCALKHDNSRGICKRDNECQIAHNLLKTRRIRPTICGFEGSQIVLCCPLTQVDLNNAVFQGGQITERISVRKCKEYKKCELNLRRKKRQYGIVGGTEALPGEYPHMVAIGWKSSDTSEYLWNCGGSLISELWVLTAAHCSSAGASIVRLGEHNLKVNDETEVQDIEIERVINHPNYRPPNKYHDIGLIRLKKQATFGNNVRPACLWQTENIISTSNKSIATGWGRVGFIEDPSDFLQGVVIDIFSEEACINFYKDRKRFLPNGIIKEQLCAGDEFGNKDTCQGDSGGPLQIRDPDINCPVSYYLIGVTSFGVGCGGANSPAVYTRVSSYVDWIESIVWPN